MNLMKLFNINYFKENLKKSKGLLAFFFGIIPLINILFLVIATIQNNSESVLISFSDLSLITCLGMYIIPLALAFLLNGFVFKKKSVDFVMSKPISRKTIYITNYIGGILVIFIMIVLNSLIFTLFGLTEALVIPFALVFDYFIYWLVAYIFVFSIGFLAISIAGNFMASLVLSAIIVFLVPFLSIAGYFLGGWNTSSYFKCSDTACKPVNYECKVNCVQDLYQAQFFKSPRMNYTAPLMIFNNDELTYNSVSIIKMAILSIVYGFVGYFLFLKRKMENNEISFKSDILHYIVKGITLIPVSFFTYLIIREEALTGIIISVAVIIFYSIVYDLITRKEIYRFIRSSIISLSVFGILIGIYALIYNNVSKVVLDVKDIDYLVYNYYDGNVKITDKALIAKLIKNGLEPVRESGVYANFDMYAKNQKYTLNMEVSNKLGVEINNIDYEKKKKDALDFNIDSIDYVSKVKLTNKLKKLIKETYSSKNFEYSENNTLITVYDYRNHKYETLNIPQGINEKLDDYVLNYGNELAINALEKKENYYFYLIDSDFSDYDSYIFDYVINKNIKSFITYLKEENKKYTSDNLMIEIGPMYPHVNLVIGDAKRFKEEFNKYKDNLKDDQNFKDLTMEFNKEEEENAY